MNKLTLRTLLRQNHFTAILPQKPCKKQNYQYINNFGFGIFFYRFDFFPKITGMDVMNFRMKSGQERVCSV